MGGLHNSFQENIHLKDDFVGLSDIPTTLCTRLRLSGCNDFNGINLLSKNLDEEIKKFPDVFIDVVIDNKSSFTSDTQKTIEIDRSKYRTLLDAFSDKKGIILSIDE